MKENITCMVDTFCTASINSKNFEKFKELNWNVEINFPEITKTLSMEVNTALFVIQASLQYSFFYGASFYKPNSLNSSSLSQTVYDAFTFDLYNTDDFYDSDIFYESLKKRIVEEGYTLLKERLQTIDNLKLINWKLLLNNINNTNKFIEILHNNLAFNDPFYKKELLAVYTIERFKIFQNIIDDNQPYIDGMYIPADYQIPKMLRSLGIVTFSDEICNKIDNDFIFTEGSKDEISIRVASIEACDMLARHFNITNEKVDRILFYNRHIINDFKHHLCYSTNY
jgi:hypothetical protein